jgi:hypothetical protein
MTNEQGPITIGLREVYDQVVALRASVDRLSGLTEETARARADHETRIRVLEKSRWPLPAVAVLIALAALIVPVIEAIK